MLCWRSDAIRELQTMLETVPAAIRNAHALLGLAHLDMMKLLDWRLAVLCAD